MDKNARRRLRRASAEKRLRYSVRKFSAGVASVAVAAFMFFGGNVVSADTLATADSSSTSTEKTTSVPDSGKNSRMDDSESAVGKDSTVTTVAESNAVSSATSTVSSTSAEDSSSKVEDKNVKSEATSEVSKASVATSQSTAATQSEARVSPATSATAESTAVSSEAAADETAAVEPKVSVEKAASQAASLATASKTPNEIARSKANSTLAAAQREVDKGYSGFRKAGESGFRSSTSQTGKVTVTKENFLDYFKLNGSATYNQHDGIVTLTPDENSRLGNFSLKSKINMNQSFKLKGQVNLGDKTQERGGADGIGFAFHTGNITDLGASGGNLGIGGLRNATGFKLDTYRNLYVPPKGGRFDTNDATFFEYGWAEDPNLGQFGSWVNTTFKKIKGQNGEYDRWWAETDAGSAQPLDSSDIDGKFHDFTIQYDGATKELTVTYRSNLGEKQWKKTVNSPEELMSMVVTASTGGNKNLQQFKIESFDFYQGASVGVRYEDEQGREIAEGSVSYPQGAFKGKTYTTEQKSIPNYDFVGLKKGSLPPSGSLDDWGNNGTVTYVYRQGTEKITDPAKLNSKVTRTIKYEYADGETAGRPALKAPVTQEATFTRTGERNRVTGVETFGAWTPATKELAQEDTPVVTGFVADKANVAAKTVTPDDKDSEEVVQYKKLGSYVPNVPDGLPKVPNLPYPNDPTDPTKPGTDLPLIPHVPGTTPVGPDGTTPLTPKDPSDPSKGYNPPPIPNDPTQDTPISYVKDGQKAIITFVDQDDNNKEVGKVVESGKSGEPIGTTNYAARLKELTDKGYEVVNDEFAGPKNFDNDNKKDQQFVVTLRQGTEKITDPAKLNSKVTRTIKYEY
uniref:lectin-like domain-containing protein n=1 Tax=Streptococcus oralis TaxID=1303 RepID=UPI001BD48892